MVSIFTRRKSRFMLNDLIKWPAWKTFYIYQLSAHFFNGCHFFGMEHKYISITSHISILWVMCRHYSKQSSQQFQIFRCSSLLYSDAYCTTVNVQKRDVWKWENAENQTFFSSKNSDFWRFLTSENQMFQLGT